MSPESCEIPKYSDEAVASIRSTLDQLAERGDVGMKKRFMLLEELKKVDLEGIDRDTLLGLYTVSMDKLGSYNPTDALGGSFSLMRALKIFAPVFESNRDAWIKIQEKWDGISNNYPEGYERRLIEEELTDIMETVGVTLKSGKDEKPVKSLFEGPFQNKDNDTSPSRSRPRLTKPPPKHSSIKPSVYNYPDMAKALSENNSEYESSQFTWYDREVMVMNGLGLKEFFDNLASFYDHNKLTIRAYTGDHEGFAELMGKSSLTEYLLPKYLFTDGRIEGIKIINGNQESLKIGSKPITYIAWTAREEDSPFFIQTTLKSSGRSGLRRILEESSKRAFDLSCTSIAPRGSWGK